MISELKLNNFRCFDSTTITLSPGINFFYGPNGSGKTSILEAAYMCSSGKSFKSKSGARKHEKTCSKALSNDKFAINDRILDQITGTKRKQIVRTESPIDNRCISSALSKLKNVATSKLHLKSFMDLCSGAEFLCLNLIWYEMPVCS